MFASHFNRNMMNFENLQQYMLSKFIIAGAQTLSLLILGLIFSTAIQAADTIIAARVWPAQDYTRITLESAQPFVYKMTILQNPDRVVLDMENIDLNQTVKSLSDKILASDPYIKQIRVANFQQNIVRLVVDLKTDAKPNAFTLTPMGEYKHRLVLDLHPLKDPLMAMISERNTGSDSTNSSGADSVDPASRVVATDSSNNNSIQPVVIAESLSQNEPVIDNQASKESQAGKSVEVIKSVDATTAKVEPKDKAEIKALQANQSAAPESSQANNKKNGREIIIAIDAGHGGEDPGARGANGSHEKDVTLMIAKKLKEKIDGEPNMRGVLTRDSDFFIPLHGRVVKARNMQADLFVSIHADSFTNQSARGSSVFALSERGATSASARYLAKKENESDLIGGVSLDDKDPLLARTLLDLSQTATINDSLKLGKAVLAQIGAINTLHASRVEQAAFAVLKSPDIPSILVETAFISNPEEERKLNDSAYQDKLVSSILTGIKKYFATNPALAKTKVALE